MGGVVFFGLLVEVNADRMRTKPQVQALAWPLDESQVQPLTIQPHAQ